MAGPYDTILYEVDDPVAVITLNRPARLNAWTPTMAREVRDAVRHAGADRRVVGVVITGAGRAFCSGGDLKELDLKDLQRRTSPSGDTQAAGEGDVAGPFGYLMNLPKPVIAAINGPAVGMGAVLPLWADLRFMADDAKLTLGFSLRGSVAEAGCSWLLPRLIGPTAALDLLMSSRWVTAEEALRLGLVNLTAPRDSLLDKARDYIGELASKCSPTSMATIKRQVYTDLHGDLRASVESARELLAAATDGEDIKEGWRSYLEKRPPQFPRIGDA
jgi:enoyl-CoA hydratase/carnithine racemase